MNNIGCFNFGRMSSKTGNGYRDFRSALFNSCGTMHIKRIPHLLLTFTNSVTYSVATSFFLNSDTLQMCLILLNFFLRLSYHNVATLAISNFSKYAKKPIPVIFSAFHQKIRLFINNFTIAYTIYNIF